MGKIYQRKQNTIQKHGLAFEKAVHAFANTLDPKAEVLFDHKVPDRDTGTPRQCDVWINAKFGGHWPLSILVSCKDHKKKLSVDDIGTFRDEIRSTGASTGVIYSKSGFTRPAIEKAKSSGIACCRLYENEPADMPNIIAFESYAFTPQVKIALVNKFDEPMIKTWGDLFDLMEDGIPLVELIEFAYLDAEKKSVEESKQFGKPYSWELTLRIVPDHWNNEIKIKVIGNWRKYHGKMEATLYNGSYSISNNSFRGTISGPWVDTKGVHPGDSWIEITDENFEMPKNRIVAILYSGHVKDALKNSLENQPLN